jgi:hypothetical protein
MATAPPLSLAGQTLRWKFDAGPTGDATYEHVFHADGTVVYRVVHDDATPPGKKSNNAGAEQHPETHYASFAVAPGMHLVSYLGSSGYTLTVLVNFNRSTVHGFASGAKEWYPLTGELLASGD